MTLKRFTAGEVGELTFDHLNRMADMLNRLEPLLPSLESLTRAKRLTTRHVHVFPARIDDWRPMLINGAVQPNRWEYAWSQVSFVFAQKNWTPSTVTYSTGGGGRPIEPPGSLLTPIRPPTQSGGSVTELVRSSLVGESIYGACALNGYEAPNNGVGVESGIDVDAPGYPAGFEVKPVPVGSVVPMYAFGGMTDYDASAPNGTPIVSRFMFCVPNHHDGDCGVQP